MSRAGASIPVEPFCSPATMLQPSSSVFLAVAVGTPPVRVDVRVGPPGVPDVGVADATGVPGVLVCVFVATAVPVVLVGVDVATGVPGVLVRVDVATAVPDVLVGVPETGLVLVAVAVPVGTPVAVGVGGSCAMIWMAPSFGSTSISSRPS